MTHRGTSHDITLGTVSTSCKLEILLLFCSCSSWSRALPPLTFKTRSSAAIAHLSPQAHSAPRHPSLYEHSSQSTMQTLQEKLDERRRQAEIKRQESRKAELPPSLPVTDGMADNETNMNPSIPLSYSGLKARKRKRESNVEAPLVASDTD